MINGCCLCLRFIFICRQNENNNSAQRAAAELAESDEKMSMAQEKSMKKG